MDTSYEAYATFSSGSGRFVTFNPPELHFNFLDDYANPRRKEEPSGELSFGAMLDGDCMVHLALHKYVFAVQSA